MTAELKCKTGMSYGTRAFTGGVFDEGKKIPLVMFGSFWEDEGGMMRFCDAGELSANERL